MKRLLIVMLIIGFAPLFALQAPEVCAHPILEEHCVKCCKGKIGTELTKCLAECYNNRRQDTNLD